MHRAALSSDGKRLGVVVPDGSVRVWDFEGRKILRTVELPGAGGTIDVRLIPGDPGRRAYTAGMIDDKLYLIDTAKGNASPVFDFATIAKGGWPQALAPAQLHCADFGDLAGLR